MREIIFADRDGKYVALDHREALVVDLDAQLLRVGLERWSVSRGNLWRLLVCLLRGADTLLPYADITAAVGTTDPRPECLSRLGSYAAPFLRQIGMTLETVETIGFRLHTDPRSTLECCRTLALGQPLPSRVKCTRAARGATSTIPVRSRSLSIPRSRQSGKAPSNSPTARP